MSERTLTASHVATMRTARDTLCNAAVRADRDGIASGIRACVDAARLVDFSPQTAASLVASALESALPAARGPARRRQRAAEIAEWVALAARLAEDAYP